MGAAHVGARDPLVMHEDPHASQFNTTKHWVEEREKRGWLGGV